MPALSVTHAPMPSFEAAQKAAGDSYLDPALLAELHASWFYVGEPRLTDLPDFFGPFFTAIAMAALRRPGQVLRVVDFGGTIGRYRAYVEAIYSGAINLHWTVVETPLYVDYGRTRNPPGVVFATSLDDLAEPVDFAIFSSVLQYLPDWKDMLDHRAIRGTENIFITRTPFGDAERPFLQTVAYPSGTVRLAARVIGEEVLAAHLRRSHALFASFALEQHLGDPMGVFSAPSMLWTRQSGLAG